MAKIIDGKVVFTPEEKRNMAELVRFWRTGSTSLPAEWGEADIDAFLAAEDGLAKQKIEQEEAAERAAQPAAPAASENFVPATPTFSAGLGRLLLSTKLPDRRPKPPQDRVQEEIPAHLAVMRKKWR